MYCTSCTCFLSIPILLDKISTSYSTSESGPNVRYAAKLVPDRASSEMHLQRRLEILRQMEKAKFTVKTADVLMWHKDHLDVAVVRVKKQFIELLTDAQIIRRATFGDEMLQPAPH